MSRRGCFGLTLVELCFGLAIVAVLAGMAMPSLRAARSAGALHGAVFEVGAGLQQARAGSIVRARPGVLCLSDATGRCMRAAGPATAWRVFVEEPGGETTLGLGSLPRGIVLYSNRPRLTFWPDSLSASAGTLTICDAQGSSRPRAIVLSQAGRTRITEGSPGQCRT